MRRGKTWNPFNYFVSLQCNSEETIAVRRREARKGCKERTINIKL